MVSEAMMAGVRKASKARSENAAARQPEPLPWKASRRKVRLFQGEDGRWYIRGKAGVGILATDWEVSLWLEICELRTQAAILRKKAEEKEATDETE